ncbi:MAG: type 4a pilus biogenesis protein PilO [Gemmatimonadales bacterium]
MALEMDPKQVRIVVMVAAVGAAVLFWMYVRKPMIAAQVAQGDSIAMLQGLVDSAKRDLREGTHEQIEARIAEYNSNLGLMRQLVPTQSEVTALVDDISRRAGRRGVVVAEVAPLSPEPQAPYEVQRYRFRVIGHYDQIGAFLTDIASLPRIMVPVELSLTPVEPAVQQQFADTSGALLEGRFVLRTFVKAGGAEEAGGTP